MHGVMICFLFIFIFYFISTKSKNQKGHTHFSHSGIKKPFSEVALQTRDSLKRPYFPLPLSIHAGTNLIMLLLLFCNPRKSIPHSISGKIHPRLISEKIHAKPPRKTQKIAFLLLPVFSGSVPGVSLLLCHWI